MPSIFKYKASDSMGAIHAGELRSTSRDAALEALALRGLMPIDLSEPYPAARSQISRDERRPSGLRFSRGLATAREILTFTESMASLTAAGLTVDRALQIGRSLAPSETVGRLTSRLLELVRSGKSLSAACGQTRQTWPPYYISMIEAGEAGGSMPETLGRLAELIRRQLQVRERIQTALFYPAILAGVVLFTLVVLLVFVLPRFEAMFAESDTPLPAATRVVLHTGRFIADYWWALVTVVGTASAALVAWIRSEHGRLHFDRWLLRSRLTFALPGNLDAARLMRTLSILTQNGLPLPSALRVAGGVLVNRCLKSALEEVTRAVQAGESLSAALARMEVFPKLAVQFARVGEETGQFADLLRSAAAVIEDDSQTRLERLLTLIVPLTTVLMGAIVAGLIGSVLIGLLSINDIAL
jgi:general secretion pathway protein F